MTTSTDGPTATRPTLLSVRGLTKRYESASRSVTVLENLDLDVAQGEFLTIVGPSGCGKTTLLKLLTGLVPATAGEVRLDGDLVNRPAAGTAVVFQEYGRSLFGWKSVAGNVELPLLHTGLGKAERRTRVAEALAAVGLTEVATSYPWQLSGGMQQRVAIARAIAHRPRVLLMDEPFAAVDAQTRAELEDLTRQVWVQFAMTVVLITHDIDEAVYVGERVLVLGKSPVGIVDDVTVDLPNERDQLRTRALPRFVELRAHVYEGVRAAANRLPRSPSQLSDPTIREVAS